MFSLLLGFFAFVFADPIQVKAVLNEKLVISAAEERSTGFCFFLCVFKFLVFFCVGFRWTFIESEQSRG
jgi:hypothetical protein